MANRGGGSQASKRKARRLGQSGQSTVEFALTVMLLLGFSLFYIQSALVYAWGSFVQYATFMSSRAYLSAGPTKDDQEERARKVITQMLKKKTAAGLDRFRLIGQGEGGGSPQGALIGRGPVFDDYQRDFSWMEGVRYTFRSRLFMIPFAGSGPGRNSVNSVTLTSESWLGRERSFLDCETEMGSQRIYDNGC